MAAIGPLFHSTQKTHNAELIAGTEGGWKEGSLSDGGKLRRREEERLGRYPFSEANEDSVQRTQHCRRKEKGVIYLRASQLLTEILKKGENG